MTLVYNNPHFTSKNSKAPKDELTCLRSHYQNLVSGFRVHSPKRCNLLPPIQDISSQLSDILDNVKCVINRFQEELGYDLKEKAKSDQMEQKGKNRFILLKKIASFSEDAKAKEKHLYEILHWLGDWGEFADWLPEGWPLPQ